MTLATFGRKPTFDILTDKERVYTPSLPFATSVAASDRALVRPGYWLQEKAATAEGSGALGGELALITDATWPAAPSSLIPRCVFSHGDADDTLFAEDSVAIIDGFGWRAKSKVMVPANIDPGDLLTITEGVDATGNYGHLEVGSQNETAVAVCMAIDSTWLTFQALQPFKIP